MYYQENAWRGGGKEQIEKLNYNHVRETKDFDAGREVPEFYVRFDEVLYSKAGEIFEKQLQRFPECRRQEGGEETS